MRRGNTSERVILENMFTKLREPIAAQEMTHQDEERNEPDDGIDNENRLFFFSEFILLTNKKNGIPHKETKRDRGGAKKKQSSKGGYPADEGDEQQQDQKFHQPSDKIDTKELVDVMIGCLTRDHGKESIFVHGGGHDHGDTHQEINILQHFF